MTYADFSFVAFFLLVIVFTWNVTKDKVKVKRYWFPVEHKGKKLRQPIDVIEVEEEVHY
jgi:hypothetical protein